ncbi:MAG: ABC transporter permease [Pseudomonadota bacterium]|nr:ABC transporter permease [Pseudomonadota bacterium]
MTYYFLRRLSQTFIVLLAMSFIVYSLIGLMPGDPIDIMVQSDPNLTTKDAARLKASYGLDQPLIDRYWKWLNSAAKGEFGYSRIHNKPVLEILIPRLSNTFLLMGSSLILALFLAIPMGIWAAMRPRSHIDFTINLFALGGTSVPIFWLGLLLIVIFSVWLGWLPASAMYERDSGALDRVKHLILPVLALALATTGQLTRHMRAAMIEVLGEDYIRTAHAKGLRNGQIIFHHALPNAMMPVITVITLSFGSLFSGALITETMFSYLGTGKLIFDSIMGNDYNMALVSLLFATALVLFGNFVADLLYARLDPRVRYDQR